MEQTLTKRPQQIRNDALTRETIALIEEKQKARDTLDWQREKQLNKIIQKAVRKDNKNNLTRAHTHTHTQTTINTHKTSKTKLDNKKTQPT